MGAYTKIFRDEDPKGKKLRITITLSTKNRPYRHIRYFTMTKKGSDRQFMKYFRLLTKEGNG